MNDFPQEKKENIFRGEVFITFMLSVELRFFCDIKGTHFLVTNSDELLIFIELAFSFITVIRVSRQAFFPFFVKEVFSGNGIAIAAINFSLVQQKKHFNILHPLI